MVLGGGVPVSGVRMSTPRGDGVRIPPCGGVRLELNQPSTTPCRTHPKACARPSINHGSRVVSGCSVLLVALCAVIALGHDIVWCFQVQNPEGSREEEW